MGYTREDIERQKEERSKYEGINNQGSKFRVTNYISTREVEIEFYDYHGEESWKRNKVTTTWGNIEKGWVYDNFYPIAQNVGFLGNATSKENNKYKQSYSEWYHILERCYSEKWQEKNPTYKGCTVSEEWKCFENFEKDYEEMLKENNFKEGEILHVDKDIIKKGNKVYCKENCVIVDHRINGLFSYSQKKRKYHNLPVGVTIDKHNSLNPYVPSCNKIINGERKQIRLGSFPTPEEAYKVYARVKEEYIKEVADEYVALGYITKESRLYKAMYEYKI